MRAKQKRPHKGCSLQLYWSRSTTIKALAYTFNQMLSIFICHSLTFICSDNFNGLASRKVFVTLFLQHSNKHSHCQVVHTMKNYLVCNQHSCKCRGDSDKFNCQRFDNYPDQYAY